MPGDDVFRDFNLSQLLLLSLIQQKKKCRRLLWRISAASISFAATILFRDLRCYLTDHCSEHLLHHGLTLYIRFNAGGRQEWSGTACG